MNNLGVTLTVLGDYDAAYETFDATVTLSEDVGDRLSLGTSRTNLAWVAASQGRWDHARGLAESSVEAKRSHGHADAEAEALLWLGHALMGLKRPSEARAAYHASLAIREELGQVALALGVHAGLARAALAEGNIESAKEHAEAIVEHLDEGGSLEGTWEPLRLHLTAVEVLRAAGDERADRVLTRAGAELRDRAARIADDDDRRTFLESIPWHRRIVELLDER